MQLSAFLGALLSARLSGLLSVSLSGGSIIDLDGTVFVQLAMFFVAFGVLHALVFKPMLALLDAREEAIDGAREQAKHLEVEVRQKQTAFEAELRKVQQASSEERDRLRGEGQELERNLLERVRVETQASINEAKVALDTEAQLARQRLGVERAQIAREIASKVLGREVQA
jgi:F-type H+-transporting ATPase subunit b